VADESQSIQQARQIFDSRGKPTLEVDVVTEDGIFRAGVPSGKSRGAWEVSDDHDGGDDDGGGGNREGVRDHMIPSR